MEVQLFLTVLLVLLFWFLSEGLEDRAVFAWWTAGWSTLLLELVIGGLYLSGASDGPWYSVLFFAVPVVGMLHVAFFLLGGRRLQRRRPLPRGNVALVLAAAAGIGAVAGTVALLHEGDGTLGMAYQMSPRNLGLAVAYPFCAFAFYRSPRFDFSVSAVLIVLGFLLYGVNQSVYGLAAAREVADHLLGLGGPGPGVTIMLTDVAFLADVAWEGAIGAGTVLLLRKEEIRARNALVSSEKRYRKLFEDSVDGIFLADDSFRILDLNDSLAEMLGWSEAGKGPEHVFDMLAPDVRDKLPEPGEIERGGGMNLETQFRRRDRTTFPVDVSLSSYGLEDRHVIQGIVRDITARKALEEHLSHRAHHHPLTDLPNRYRFRQEVEAALARMGRGGAAVGLLFLDLDGFKQINDSLGHPAGDEVLIRVGRRLESAIREADTVAHMGGDEFTVLLHGCGSRRELDEAGTRILEAVEGPTEVDGTRIEVKASVGGTLARDDDDLEDLLRRADQAMYRAKESASRRLVLAPEAAGGGEA